MKNLNIILFITLVMGFVSCNSEDVSGPTSNYNLELADIKGVNFQTTGHVYIQYGEEQTITIETQPEVFEHLSQKVEDEIWKISINKNLSNFDLNIYVTLPQLKEATASSSGNISISEVGEGSSQVSLNTSSSGDIKLEDATGIDSDLVVNISSSGNVEASNIEANRVVVNISSSGDASLVGATSELVGRISSSGNCYSNDMTSDKVDFDISSSGDAYVHCVNEYNVNLSSSGNFYFKGNPTVREANTSSSGEVIQQ
ncbi:DUF2807 domain-containing protein [Flammeovirga sp. SubArs3]|uniref:GIN domain-containing protein n=1 Tax=Flammeovirga sp. SubArs3 TaxID=2995316 RepID=UPI00248C22B4|nr:DUF2807 domain-containing protein [Flammeovirga sp. SubArs3]